MNLINLLSVSINTYGGFGMPFKLDWIGRCIQWLIENCVNIGVGIIVFTLCLKLITLPFDIISRTSMKKNNIKMEQMRPTLEKLKRQYANNKQLYNQKLQALYKKNGYSMFASCLPSLLTVVIFIVVVNQFSTYSNYASVQLFNDMSRSYTSAIENYDPNVVYIEKENGETKKTVLFEETVDGQTIQYYTINAKLNENYVFDNTPEFADYKSFITKTAINEYEASFVASDVNALAEKVKVLNEGGFTAVKVGETEDCHIIKDGTNYIFNKKMYFNTDENIYLTQDEMNAKATPKVMDYLFENYAKNNVVEAGRRASQQYYLDNAPAFLWIKNIWVGDLPYKHPVNVSLSSYDFAKSLGSTSGLESQYSEITYYLGTEKTAPNGYFILVVLSVGIMFLSQFIMTKLQTQTDLQSVDGSSAMNSKMMMWMMPIIFGVFAFFYSGAFSLYMTVSSLLSTLSTLIINYIVGLVFKKKYGAE